MPRTVVIHDPLLKKKPEVITATPSRPKPVTGKVYIILNTVDGMPGAHVTGTFTSASVAVGIVHALSGDKSFKLGGPPARSAEAMWEVVVSEVVETCP
jgi:hypothetical protein